MWAFCCRDVKNHRFACLWAAGALCACAQKAPPASPGQVDPTGAPALDSTSTNVDELESQLAAAERQLNAQLSPALNATTTDGEKGGGGLDQSAEETASPEVPAEPPPPGAQPQPGRPKPASRGTGPVGGATAQTKSVAPSCDTVCKALASMERSADRICEITSSEDSRCTRARKRVESATTRVDQSGCSCAESD